MSSLDTVFILLPGCAFVLFIVSFIFLRLTLDRRVRNSLPKDKVYDSALDWYFGLGRTFCFGYAIVFEFHNRSYQIKSAYNGINIKRFANAFEKVIAYAMVSSLCTLLVLALIFYIVDLFGMVSDNG